MADRRRHPDDEIVHLVRNEHGGIHIRWRHHDSEEHYGGEFVDDEARQVLLEEGYDPDEFFQSIQHPFWMR